MSLIDYNSPLVSTATANLAQMVPIVVAAGNDSLDACAGQPSGMGSMDGVVTVGASNSADAMAAFFNRGACVDLFAPGVDTAAADPHNFYGEILFGGTSGASPHVAGVMAKFLSINPTYTPAQLEAALKGKGNDQSTHWPR